MTSTITTTTNSSYDDCDGGDDDDNDIKTLKNAKHMFVFCLPTNHQLKAKFFDDCIANWYSSKTKHDN